MNNAVSLDICLVIKIENDAISQLIFVGAERTNEVTKPFGEHRNRSIYEVNTCGSLHSFTVNDTAFLDIMAHVGNVNTHLPQPFIELFDRECVVKVLGIVRVDGAGEDITEVFSLGFVLLRDFSGNPFCGLFHGFWIDIRQAVLG